ncbi:hypothetical protein CHS0354_025603 [Potamilus streckersoni]|uniref:Uncharacterized protein n=1 Tax=Potamilus streckersoni TaxID=2493646 RepID=A0AAE0VNL0_9BIVA|nr:hypothetical protein CHS0354_025603 [Potamilus streckersoni]
MLIIHVNAIGSLEPFFFSSSNLARVSNDTIIAQTDIGESHQEETSSEHYWTIVTNARGKVYTALERNIDVELRDFINPARSARLGYDANTTPKHRNSEELEVYSHSFNSDTIDIEKRFSDSIEREGYIIPISSDQENEYIDPTLSHHSNFNEYINPIPSDPYEFDGSTDPSSAASKEDNRSTDDSITSYPGMSDECTDPNP